MKNFTTIQIEIIDKIAVLKFNRPEQLNAMNRQMMDEIIEAIQWINSNEETAVALIFGEGRAFMAGADIKEYGTQTAEEFESFQEKGKQLYESIENASKPWIAAVNGFALGGGFEIALSCDLIVASGSAIMGLPEVFLSLIPGGGGTQRLIQKVGINRVKEMLFLGAQFDAATMYSWGIVNRVFIGDDFFAQAMDFAGKLSRRSESSVAQLKRLANLSLQHIRFDEKINDEARTVKALYLTEEAQTAIQNFIKKSENRDGK
ncbi:enoyl-CoA hydratase/isomerase family protein [uncultured Sunxiuqinia sp.]|uniref:enoyl-CoA hydratase/isomerase family protein n=1 Tax=uncultured Sunxiuqinia sp. TaxID=1573825 RepID=UPI0030D6D493